MQTINEIVNTMLLTCCVAHDKPVSCLLVGPSGGGKSMTLMRWKAPWIHHTNDITSIGMSDIIESDPKNEIRSIILPDFNLPLSHRSSVTTLTVANMLSVMSEGTCRVDDGRVKKELKHVPMSFISACTPDMYFAHYRKWRSLGLLRRFLVVNYRYGLPTRREGNGKIRSGKIGSGLLPERQIPYSVNESGIDVRLDPREAKDIELLSLELARNLGYNISRDFHTKQIKWTEGEPALEFSPHLTLQAIARANALRMKRRIVRKEDIDFLVKILTFTNPSNPGLL